MAARLSHYEGERAVVFALPRGGVPVAAPIAEALHAPIDLVLARKMGSPFSLNWRWAQSPMAEATSSCATRT